MGQSISERDNRVCKDGGCAGRRRSRDGRSLSISERKEPCDRTGEASGDWLRYYRPHAPCYVS